MTTSPTILALFLDRADAMTWNRLLAALPVRVEQLTGRKIPVGIRSLAAVSFRPLVALVSARLYPSPAANLVKELQRAMPGVDVVVLASADEPQLAVRPLLDDGVRHLAVADPREPDHALAVIRTLIDRQPWDLTSYLGPAARLLELAHIDPARKEATLERVGDLLGGEADDLDLLRQRALLLADEMLENAFRASCPSGTEERVRQETHITLRAGFDGASLALQVIDRQGCLYPEDALSYLAQHQDGMVPPDQAHGRGLFIIWRFLDHFHVNIRPGKETVIGGQLRLSAPIAPEQPKGFHFFVQHSRISLSPA